MSLSAHDRHELGAIEQELAASAPQLAAMLVTFSRLTVGEPMPGFERIPEVGQPAVFQAAFGLVPGRPARRRATGAPRARRVRLSWQAVVVVWLIICAALITVAVLLSHTVGKDKCAPPWVDSACVTHAPARPQPGR